MYSKTLDALDGNNMLVGQKGKNKNHMYIVTIEKKGQELCHPNYEKKRKKSLMPFLKPFVVPVTASNTISFPRRNDLITK